MAPERFSQHGMSTCYVPGPRDTRIRTSLPSKSSGSGDSQRDDFPVELGVFGAPQGESGRWEG